jgi:hypothetical protein
VSEVSAPIPYNSITELMERDPLLLSREDITAIIEHFRKSRVSFNTTARAPKATKAPTKKATLLASLGDVSGIEL